MAAPFIVTKTFHSWDNWYLTIARKRPDGTRGKRLLIADRMDHLVYVRLGRRMPSVLKLPKWA